MAEQTRPTQFNKNGYSPFCNETIKLDKALRAASPPGEQTVRIGIFVLFVPNVILGA